MPPHLTVSTEAWLRRHLGGPVLVVDGITDWLDEVDTAYVGWQWKAPRPED